MESKKTRKKGLARTKTRKSKIAFYYEMVYPVRKLRRIWKHSHDVGLLRKWADNYRTPTGVSGAAALVRLNKELKLSL